MDLWSLAIDALWIVVLSLMSSASLGASKRVPKDIAMPLMGVSLPRTLALALIPAVSVAVWLSLVVLSRSAAGDSGLIVLGLRLVLPPLLAIVHLNWLRAALKRLQDEGRIQG